MSVKVNNLSNQNRRIIHALGCFKVLEYEKDLSVSAFNAQTEYFMSKMDVRRRQVYRRAERKFRDHTGGCHAVDRRCGAGNKRH